MNKPSIWLRAETKTFERRTPLIPEGAEALIAAGFSVTSERSVQSIYDYSEYKQVGCKIVDPGSWPDASKETIILGLKEIPQDTFPLIHDHIYFAHAYKEQQGWQDLLTRFVEGGGTLYDLEYLLDENQQRIAAFGYWAGFAGAALGLLAWSNQKRGEQPPITNLSAYENKSQLIHEITGSLAQLSIRPRVLVIGAKGRCGRGAVDAAHAVGLDVVEWDIEETKAGGPFAQINQMDMFVNGVFVNGPLPPFLTDEQLQQPDRKLSVIVDVSCDVNSSFNPLPIYTQCTDFKHPCCELISGHNPLNLIAIDHLPSLLPVESSEDYARQLLKHLLTLGDKSNPVWHNAAQVFQQKSAILTANIEGQQ